MKKTWKQINKIIHKGKNKDNINCIKTSQGIENNPHVISNKFNSYFTTIAQNLVSKIKNAPDFQQILDQQVQESIFLNPTTKEQEAPIFREQLLSSRSFLKSPVLRWSCLECQYLWIFQVDDIFANLMWKSWLVVTKLGIYVHCSGPHLTH